MLQLWDPALSICSLHIMWLIWENDWDHIKEYQSPHLKGALNCNFDKKKKNPPKQTLWWGRSRLCQTKSMDHQGSKVRDHDLCRKPSRAHAHVSVYTVCDIKKGRDWVIQSGPWRKGYFFSPSQCLCGGLCYWLPMLGHLKETPEPLKNVSQH